MVMRTTCDKETIAQCKWQIRGWRSFFVSIKDTPCYIPTETFGNPTPFIDLSTSPTLTWYMASLKSKDRFWCGLRRPWMCLIGSAGGQWCLMKAAVSIFKSESCKFNHWGSQLKLASMKPVLGANHWLQHWYVFYDRNCIHVYIP